MGQLINRKSSFFQKITYALIFFLLITVAYSCSSHSVREIRENKHSSKKSKAADDFKRPKLTKAEIKENDKVVKDLFSLRSSQIEIVLPNMLGAELDTIGSVVISEDAIMANWRASQNVEASEVDAANLSSLLANTQGVNIPERNSLINTGFIVRVPKNLLNSRTRLTISPKIRFNNDSVIQLKDVVIRGTAFAAKQEEAYAAYEKYLSSIVGKDKYDEKFLDHEGVGRDLKKRQDLYYNEYYESWKKLMDYEKWKEEYEDANAYDLARKIGYRKENEYEAKRAAREDAERRLAQGKDTAGIYARHMARFEKKFAKFPSEFTLSELELEDVPKRFRDIHLASMNFTDLNNMVLTEDDSLNIAKHRYLYDEIAVNEVRDSLKEERMQMMIPYPYRSDVMLDTIIDGGQDFVFYYPHRTILPQSEASYELQVENSIDIVGHASFVPESTGVLKYEVASLNDLIKPELETKGTKVIRNLYSLLTIYPKYETERSDFKIRYQDNKDQIEKLKEEYQKYVLEPGYILDSVVMQTTSSLDGTFMYNWTLSDKRGQALKKYLAEHVFPTLDVENLFKHTFKGEDWNTLIAKIKERDDMPNKDAILTRLGEVSVLEDTDIAEREIRKAYKKDYKIMQDSIYPLLKKTAFVFFMHRPGMEADEEMRYTKIEGYQEALKQMRERKYWDAIKLLSENPDFNTALCLAAMGENQKAYGLLMFLDKDADVNYLLAIVAYRLGYDNEAIEVLKKACAEDKSKLERIPYDPEIVQLIKKYNL